ncbi:MAG: hypothetical protein D6706_08255 [Chloroflexi bacterium]|nr:MAG: hypothetical protein D6706_08255 [Chloroflexota bacterium]
MRNVTVTHEKITPNADGDNDVTQISYELSRNATVSIYFENEAGERYYFRKEKPRGAGEYRVLFSGIVDGYRLPGETVAGEILTRLLQNGTYTWTIEATDDRGVTEKVQGSLIVADADTVLPELRNFTLDKHVFTPNRDGIDDRVLAQFFLTKEVAELRVFLLTPEGIEVPISELERDVPPLMPGRHYYDYEGGVDNGETPPPDGTYPIVAVAQDHEGQRVRVEDSLTIQFGGVPRADIVSPPSGDTVMFDKTAVPLCHTLTFTLTVHNYGTTPIRTTGPAPGFMYDSDWNYNTVGWPTESGAWRVAIGFENELTNYPYRWAVGSPDDLQEIDGHMYLMPGERAVVTGSIRITGPLGERNPQPMWAGLIHEDVEIAQFNNRVDPHEILIDMPDEAHIEPCEPREVPQTKPEN